MPFPALTGRQEVFYPLVLGGVYLLFRALFWHHLPIWDSGEYYEQIITAQSQPFDFLNWGQNHNSQLWFWIAGWVNYLFPHNYVAFNIWLSLLSTACIIGQYYLLRHLAYGQLTEGEILLAAALLAFLPAIPCNLVHFNTDMGVYFGMVGLSLALLKGRTWYGLAAACLMMFSKETAVALLPLMVLFCALFQPAGQRLTWMKRHSICLIIPFILIAAYCYYKVGIRHEPLIFKDTSIYPRSVFIHIGIDGDSFISYLMMGFILNGNWAIVLLGLGLAVWLWKHRAREEGRRAYWQHWPAYALLLSGTFFVVFSIRHFNNTRYLIPWYFSMLLTLFFLLPAIRCVRLRKTILGVLLAAMVWQNFRTIDPVSLRVFCITQWGDHTVLNVTNCLGEKKRLKFLARDPLVYDMEFTYLPPLLEKIENEVNKTGHPVPIAVSAHYLWHLSNNPNVVALQDMPHKFQQQPPQEFYFILFPSEPYYGLPGEMAPHYRLQGAPKVYDLEGYKLPAFHYVLKAK